jgi:uncharacterized membrane protein
MGIVAILIYIIFCFIAAAAASNRGRSGFGYFFLSLILSPIISLIIIVVLGENKKVQRRRIAEDAEIRENIAQVYRKDRYNNTVLANNSNKLITYNDTKKCPFCAEFIKPEAIVCRFCGKDIPNFIATHRVKSISNGAGIGLSNIPNRNVEPSIKIPNGTEVQFIEMGEEIEFMGIKAPWIKIKTDEGVQGWCFSGSLEKM